MQRLLMECAVRAALIALGTAAVLGLLRVKSAGARHAAWAGVVALMLLLPAWMAWGPRASLRLLPARPAPVFAATPILLLSPMLPAPEVHASIPAAPPAPWNWLAILYLSGVSILAVRLTLGTLRAHALVRRAARIDGRLTSPSCAAPVTVGWLRPAIILPEGWRAWSQQQLDAVLTHEGEHVRRRDPLVQWLALLNRAVFWFHPLAWWLEYRLSALAEEACDAAVLERGHDPRDYSAYLLELARSVRLSGARVNLVAMAMPGSSLPRRIRQILAHGPVPRLTRVRAICLAAACAALSVVFAAASVDRQPCVPQPPAPPPLPAQIAVPAAPPAPPSPAAAPMPFAPPAPPATPTPAAAPSYDPPSPPPDLPTPAAAPTPPAPPFSPVWSSPTPAAAPVPPPPLSPMWFTPTPAAAPAPAAPFPPPPAPTPAAAPLPAPPAQYPQTPPPPPAPPIKYYGHRLIALYFDLDGMPAELQARATSASAGFVESQMQPNDLVAIIQWSAGRINVVEDFTGDRDRLIADLAKIDNSPTSDAGGLYGLMNATMTLRTLREQKALIYFTGPAFRQSVGRDQLQTLIEAAQQANVAFYPVDVSALPAADRK